MAQEPDEDDADLVSMKRTKAEVKEMSAPTAMDDEQYPYGLRISLQNDELEKLGIDKLPGVGDTFELEAIVVVKSVSAGQSEGGEKRRSIELQITEMCLETEGEAPNKVAATIA